MLVLIKRLKKKSTSYYPPEFPFDMKYRATNENIVRTTAMIILVCSSRNGSRSGIRNMATPTPIARETTNKIILIKVPISHHDLPAGPFDTTITSSTDFTFV